VYRVHNDGIAIWNPSVTQITLADYHVQVALRHGVNALKRVANCALPAALERRLQELGENKDQLGAAEHEELLALVTFTHERTIEKLQAQLAMHELEPFLVDDGVSQASQSSPS
jgi:hypothetical protein